MLARAFAAGLSALIEVGADLEGSRRAVEMAASDSRIFATVGIHPHEAATTTPDDWAALTELPAAPNRVVAIGECGLDKGPHNHAPLEKQVELFLRHIGLARKTGLPLVVHNRDTYPELFRILDAEVAARGPLSGVMHCFSGGPEEARHSVELGFYVSFSGVLTFKNAEATRAAARVVPRDRLLVETDCPYLTPEPHRGKRNEPSYVVHTAQRLAEVLGVAPDEMARITAANARRAFRLPEEKTS